MRYLADGYGRSRAEWFLKLPSRKAEPGYYELIDQPRALSRIAKKVRVPRPENLRARACV